MASGIPSWPMVKFNDQLSFSEQTAHSVNGNTRTLKFKHDAIALRITTAITNSDLERAIETKLCCTNRIWEIVQIMIQWNGSTKGTSLLEAMSDEEVRDALELMRIRQAAGVDCIWIFILKDLFGKATWERYTYGDMQ
jgi:hypothetical protein